MNFQMFKLDLEKAENQRSNCQHLVDHQKAKEYHQKKIYFWFIDYPKTFVSVDHNKLWKFQEMGIPDHLTCLLRNLCGSQEETELNMEQETTYKSGKEYIKVVYCHPAYLTYMQCTSCEMPDWMNHSWKQDCQEEHQ